MKKITCCLLLLLLILISCNRKDHFNNDYIGKLTESEILTTDVKMLQCTNIEGGGDIEINRFIEDYKFVLLETTDSSLIGNIDKLIITEDRIYVADYRISKTVFVFNINGAFLFKINSEGKGPGEYLSLEGMALSKNGELILLANTSRLLFFDSNGIFKNEVVLGFWTNSVEVQDSCSFVLDNGLRNNVQFMDGDLYNLFLVDAHGQVYKKFFQYDHLKNRSYINFYSLFRSGGRTYFNPYDEFKLFSISNNILKLEYEINFENRTPPNNFWRDFRKKYRSSERYKVKSEIEFVEPGQISLSDRYVFCRFYFKNEVKNAMFSLSDYHCVGIGNSYFLKSGEVNVKLDCTTLNSSGRTISFILQPQYFADMQYYNILGAYEKEIFSKIKKDDNPFILISNLK